MPALLCQDGQRLTPDTDRAPLQLAVLRRSEWSNQALRLVPGRRCEGLRTGSPASSKASRRWAAKLASASAKSTTDGFAAITSTRRPCSSQVRAVAGPMTAMIVDACGFPAIPTRLRTVDDDVNTTASNLPVLIASRIGAGGGVARTVR